jgi:hypothetical protein
MLKNIQNKRAQAVMGEYVVVIFLVIAVISTMTIFFKRAVQARIHDARDYMVSEVRERTRGEFDGNLYKEYEPYYVNTAAPVARVVQHKKTLLEGGTSGIFLMDMDEQTDVTGAVSVTLPPSAYNRTTPRN